MPLIRPYLCYRIKRLICIIMPLRNR